MDFFYFVEYSYNYLFSLLNLGFHVFHSHWKILLWNESLLDEYIALIFLSGFSALGLGCLTWSIFLNYCVLITYLIVVTEYLQIVAYVRKEGFIYLTDTKTIAHHGQESMAAGARGSRPQCVQSGECLYPALFLCLFNPDT